MKTTLFVTMALLASMRANAASAGWDDHATHMTLFQALNVGILFGALFYFLRHAVVSFFDSRSRAYHAQAENALKDLQEAQAKFTEVQTLLTKVESTWAEVLARAEADAVEQGNQVLLATEQNLNRLLDDSKKAMQQEFVRLQNELYKEVVSQATQQVSEKLKTQLSSEDHKRLQQDFGLSIQGMSSL